MTGHANEPYQASEVPQGGTYSETDPGSEGPPSIGSPMTADEPAPSAEYYPYNDSGQNDVTTNHGGDDQSDDSSDNENY